MLVERRPAWYQVVEGEAALALLLGCHGERGHECHENENCAFHLHIDKTAKLFHRKITEKNAAK
jgi:hypothetical protein